MIRIIVLFVTLIFFIECEDGESKLQKKNQTQNEFLLFLLKYREEGNCKKSVLGSDNSTKTTSCNRKPRGFCNINQSLTNQGEINFLFSEAKKVRDRTPECETSFFQSGILLTTATTTEEESNIRLKHEYVTVISCENDGFVLASNTSLATFDELKFLETARGKIGRTAKVLSLNPFVPASTRASARTCLEKEFIDTERNIFTDVTSGKIITEISK